MLTSSLYNLYEDKNNGGVSMSSILGVNEAYIKYSYTHRIAFRFVVEKLFAGNYDLRKELLKRAKNHDMDKMYLYYLGVPKDDASNYHRATASHHMENSTLKEVYDFIEAIVDYECAGYTKADKPLNAYDTVIKYNKPYKEILISLMNGLDIAKSYANTPENEEWLVYCKSYVNVTDEEIKEEIQTWAYNHPKKAAKLEVYANLCKV